MRSGERPIILHIECLNICSCVGSAEISETTMANGLSQNHSPRRVATRALRKRLLAGLNALGQIEGTEAAAVVVFGWPAAVRRRRLIRVMQPSASQWSSARRAVAALLAAGIVVHAGQRGRRKIYRLRRDAEALASLSVETLH